MACKTCTVPNNPDCVNVKSILVKDPNHVLLLCDVKHAIQWSQGIDSLGFVAPYEWCKDVKKNRKDGSGGSEKEEW